MLKAWGVNTAAFPALTALPADKPLEDIGRYIPMASSELRFSKLQLNLSIPQAAMSATARAGWIRPNGMKAYLPRC
jgi:outer membrane usher protein